MAVLATLVGGAASLAVSASNGPQPHHTGAPEIGGVQPEYLCTSCHSGFPPDDPGVSLEILDVPEHYVPGVLYPLRVRLSSTFPPPYRWGFQITVVRESDGSSPGTWDISGHPELFHVVVFSGPVTRSYVEQNASGTYAGIAGPVEWTFRWRAPSADQGRIHFFASGCAANNDNAATGDRICTASASTTVLMGDAMVGLTGLLDGSAAWGDYDGDGDLDLVLTGQDSQLGRAVRLYRNDGGATPTFTSMPTNLPPLSLGSTAWGDYDQDADLDLLVTGTTSSGTFVSRIYRNEGEPTPTFTDINAGLEAVSDGSDGQWGDFDGDGDLDVGLAGRNASGPTAKLYRNDGGLFTELVGALPFGITQGSLAWGDYDNDGDLDLLITGNAGGVGGQRARVLRNGGGANPTFTDVPVGLAGSFSSSGAWGDYDNDGDLDLLITGQQGGVPKSTVYENGGGPDPTFTDIGASLQGVTAGAGTWGDLDNDGWLDVAISGYHNTSGVGVSKVYRNQGGPDPTFTEFPLGLTGVRWSSVAWGDYDNDHDADLLIAGTSNNGAAGAITKLYRNHSDTPPNTPPAAPTGLHLRLVGPATVEFSWNAASDAETPAAGLSYNLRIGTTPGGNQISAAMADGATGFRRVPALGNASQRLSSVVRLPAVATYYWSVQTIDGSWIGSPFAAEQTVDVALLDAGDPVVPTRFALGPGSPNPFSSLTRLSFDLPRPERVRLEVFDANGRRVRTLVSEPAGVGRHHAAWDGADDRGHRVAAGVYLFRLVAGSYIATRRIVMLP